MIEKEETIVALATPQGQGAIAVIRLSGNSALEIVQKCICLPLPTHQNIALRKFYDSERNLIDELLISVFHSPHSYTGEDVVELSCHGGMFIVNRLLSECQKRGAQLAKPGEFTQRAFLNQKMDLSKAESIMDIISSNSETGLKISQGGFLGKLSEKIVEFRHSIVSISSEIEAHINFPEEDIKPATLQYLSKQLLEVQKSIQLILKKSHQGRILKSGIRTVICGRPNAGKSSLLNSLLGYERAIVSQKQGTTRDTIEEFILLKSVALCLVDTAGISQSEDVLESEGIKRSLKALNSADMILEVVDGSIEKQNFLVVSDSRKILVINKSDLSEHPSWASVKAPRISCVQEDLSSLEEAIFDWISQFDLSEKESFLSVNQRQTRCLESCLLEVQSALNGLKKGIDTELICIHLNSSLNFLSEFVGGDYSEEILDRIFENFCIGK